MDLKIRTEKHNIKFVRKAQSYGVPQSQQAKAGSAQSKLGLERPGHKYIKRENLGGGKYRYIYDEAQGKRAPSDKDTVAMVGDFKSALSQDKMFKRYEKHFEDSEYRNAGRAMIARGEEVTPEAFVQEMSNLQEVLGTKVSEYLPAGVAAKEYKQMFNMAGSRTTEYNQKLEGAIGQKDLQAATQSDRNLSNLKRAGLSDQKLSDFKKNPRKIKELMESLKTTYDSFTNTGQ